MNNRTHSSSSYDLLICGGGLVGASLALMLKPLGLRIALIEAQPFSGNAHPSFDERTTALSNSTRRIFDAIGVWPLLQSNVTPIKRIHVSDQGRFGFARLSAEEQGIPAMGYVVPNWHMGKALWTRLQQEGINVIAPATVKSVDDNVTHRMIGIETPDGLHSLSARLVVAADGAHSVVREAVGIQHHHRDYGQVAVIANALTQKFHDHVAYERFTPKGPVAVLPLADARVGVILTVASERAADALAWSDAEFLSHLQREFGFRLGRFIKVGERHHYPLALIRADAHIAHRVAVIGNAAQMLHPIAGQGLNLGLRDAATLAEVLADAHRDEVSEFDPGNAPVLQRYSEWRQQDSKRIIAFTDGLVRVFNQPLGVIKFARDVGLLTFDLLPVAKDALSQLSVGASGRVPRLARGALL
ncbi:MAG TPA: 2-octaprenyl-6-methoxyphenyl hydroxylase [Steroidobacteraceae bacterium]|nr:2-octaprenyl-6-methoxyphenyl hydroxylase [Steroidobacteraceae bacterium]